MPCRASKSYLDGCSIEDGGFIGLAVALEQNSSLQILNLREIILVSMALWHWQRVAKHQVLQQIGRANGSFESIYRCCWRLFRRTPTK
jgi:hypothetical protein